MRNLRFLVMTVLAGTLLVGGLSLHAQGSSYSPDQIKQMVAPIALYPDALMSQVLMAATFPDQVRDAGQWMQANAGLSGSALDNALATATWDPSVIALCKFPTVLDRMAQNIQWTTDLGNAFLNQKADVMDAAQRLRRAAYDSGHLNNTPQQRVEVQDRAIVIQPASPDVIYVPAYEPAVVYGSYWNYPYYYYPGVWSPWPGYAFVNGFAWGLGFFFGNILFGGCDWYHHDVWVNNAVIWNNGIYHGCPYYRHGNWNGGYGHQPWNHYGGGRDYARGGSGAPYGGRDYGRIRGISPGTASVASRGPMDLHGRGAHVANTRGSTGRPEPRTIRPLTPGATGFSGHANGRPAAHGPTGYPGHGNSLPVAHGPTGYPGHGNSLPVAHGPTGYPGHGNSFPAAHGPTGYSGHGNSLPVAHGPAGYSGRSYARPETHTPAGHSQQEYNRPAAHAPAASPRPAYSHPSVHAPSGSSAGHAFGGHAGGLGHAFAGIGGGHGLHLHR